MRNERTRTALRHSGTSTRRALHALIVAGALACLAAWPPAETRASETKLASEIVTAASINPNRHGAPQPVNLRIFYLAHEEKFMQAGFADLVSPASTVLGDELVRRVERLVRPGETVQADETFDEKAKFIGVVADFTELDTASWRCLVEVPVKRWTEVLKLFKSSKLHIGVDGITVSCSIVNN